MRQLAKSLPYTFLVYKNDLLDTCYIAIQKAISMPQAIKNNLQSLKITA